MRPALTSSATALESTVYVGSVEATDAEPATVGGVSAQRFVSFGGATVAVESRTAAGVTSWSLVLGDVQGSAQVMVELLPGVNDAGWEDYDRDNHVVSRSAYTPCGATRADGLDINRGWLGQVEDEGTGLTYLNARYYDPATMRFISPDPLMNPGDPRTLDPYKYANNNPVAYTDATGLTAACSGLSGKAAESCNTAVKTGWSQKAPGKGGPDNKFLPPKPKGGIAKQIIDRMTELTAEWRESESGNYEGVDKKPWNDYLRSVLKFKSDPSWSTYGDGLAATLEDPRNTVIPSALFANFWKKDGPHDFKVQEREEFGVKWDDVQTLEGTDISYYPDALGNIQFGYLSAAWGVDEDVAIAGSNFGYVAGKQDSFDDQMIRAGYALFDANPDALTSQAVVDYFDSDAYRDLHRDRGRPIG